MKMTIFLIFLASVPLLATDKNSVVATVNGRKITLERFDQTYKENLLFVGPRTVTKERVLNDLINRELGIEKARKGRLDQDTTVKRKMEDVMYHAQISRDLESQFKGIKISDRELERYYNENSEYRTAHILFRMRTNPSKAESEEAMKRAMAVYATLRESPGKFAELANKYSQTTTAPNGGDVGFRPSTQYAPEYFKAIKGKSIGHITSPVRTYFGIHIIKVLGVKKFADINKPLYKKIIYDQKRDQIMERYFEGMRKSASISVNKSLLGK